MVNLFQGKTYADETGIRIAGAGKYLHTVANATTTHLWASIGRHSMHRGLNAHCEEKSPLIGFGNTIMHDRFQTYNKFEKAIAAANRPSLL